MSDPKSAGYVLGHDDRELARLEQQAAFFADGTRHGLERAGLRPGMRVLDLGCGVGDVAFAAADLVGDAGKVVAIDAAESAIAIAKRRAAAKRKTTIELTVAEIDTFDRYGDFDAVVGRFIVVHLANPAETIGRIRSRMKEGAILQFAELDFTTSGSSEPLALTNELQRLVSDVYRRIGRDPNTGTLLYSLFRGLGLDVELFGYTRIGRSSDLAGTVFLAESIKSLLPLMEKVGLKTAAELEPPTLVERIRAEASPVDCAVFYPRLVTAWAKV